MPSCSAFYLLHFYFSAATGFLCDGKSINFCKRYSASWKISRISWDQLHLLNCKEGRPQAGDQLLLFVSRGKLYNFGKYDIVTVKMISLTTDSKG